MTRGWTGPRSLAAAVLTLALGGLFAAPAGAATMTSEVVYSTSGSVITSTGVTGPSAISFNAVASGGFLAPSSFSLGEFLVSALPAGVSTTYEETPFEINFIANLVNGTVPDPNETPIKLTGKLNGTVNGPNQSSVVATFDPVPMTKFRTGDFLNELSVTGTVLLVPSSNNNGRTTVQGRLVAEPSPIPEPATVTIFLAAAAGFGLRRRLRKTAIA